MINKNKFYFTLSVKPSNGTGVPHLRSRVIHRGLRPSLSQASVIVAAVFVQ